LVDHKLANNLGAGDRGTIMVMPSPQVAKTNDTPDERVHFIAHQGRKILLVDLSHCLADSIEKIIRHVPDVVSVLPRGSVSILSDFTGAFLNEDVVRVIKESAVFDKPYVKKSALVRTESLPPHFIENLSKFSGRIFHAFKSRNEALEWLVKE
jgi:hypothetical protein